MLARTIQYAVFEAKRCGAAVEEVAASFGSNEASWRMNRRVELK